MGDNKPVLFARNGFRAWAGRQAGRQNVSLSSSAGWTREGRSSERGEKGASGDEMPRTRGRGGWLEEKQTTERMSSLHQKAAVAREGFCEVKRSRDVLVTADTDDPTRGKQWRAAGASRRAVDTNKSENVVVVGRTGQQERGVDAGVESEMTGVSLKRQGSCGWMSWDWSWSFNRRQSDSLRGRVWCVVFTALVRAEPAAGDSETERLDRDGNGACQGSERAKADKGVDELLPQQSICLYWRPFFGRTGSFHAKRKRANFILGCD